MQKNNLNFSSKIEVRKSPIEGWGVFAKDNIKKGEILEESPFIILSSFVLANKPIFEILKQQNLINPKETYSTSLIRNLGFKDADEYYFKWIPKHQPENEELVYTVLPLGFGPIYNTSNSTNNAEWRIENNYFVFSASKDIKKDEEICTFYGYFLDEEGNKFECDDVYNLGLDYFNGIVAFNSIRFSNLKSHINSNNDPFFLEVVKILKNTVSPIRIIKLVALSSSDQEQASIKIPNNVSLKNLFNKLKECKNSSFSKIKFIFEYQSKTDLLTKEVDITWRR